MRRHENPVVWLRQYQGKSDDEDKSRRKPSSREADREPARRAKPDTDAPRARQQAIARPSIVSGGGSGHSTMIGVGF